jgi:hypothetical protein
MNSGVYVIRARKPAARMRIPVLSWHMAYVGESNVIALRIAQHFVGGGKYSTSPKPWADREPYVWLRIPLPPWKWLMRSVETLVILLLWPVYNDRKNRWNPRRISLRDQAWQRSCRDAGGVCLNWTYGHTAVLLGVPLLLWLVLR